MFVVDSACIDTDSVRCIQQRDGTSKIDIPGDRAGLAGQGRAGGAGKKKDHMPAMTAPIAYLYRATPSRTATMQNIKHTLWGA